jgi:organic hydroperoxide reductase OsmC/OhrA
MRTRVETAVGRNEQGRVRVQRITVRIEPEVAEEDVPRMKRCLQIFEQYCVVTGSVRGGIDVTAHVLPVVTVPAVA